MPIVTQAAYARHRGISRQAVNKRVRNGDIPVVNIGGDTMIDVDAADAAWVRNTDPATPSNSVTGNPGGAAPHAPARGAENGHARAGPRNAPDDVVQYSRSRAVREAWRARREAHLFEVETKTVVKADEVRAALSDAVRRVRDAILSVPDRASAELGATEEDRDRIRAVLNAELRQALDKLSSDFRL